MRAEDEKHLKSLLRHVDNVSQSCLILGERIIESGDQQFGINLIANGRIHDHSKFYGSEWLYLRPEFISSDKEPLFHLAKKSTCIYQPAPSRILGFNT